MATFPLTFPVNILLLGSGELGKELTISLQRLGCNVTACDTYAGAPAMQVATDSRVIDMTSASAVQEVVSEVRPDLIVPEVEKLAVDALGDAARAGYNVVPSAHTVALTFDRQGIRTLAAEVAKVPTSPYAFAASLEELRAGAQSIGFPCFVKPTMSSSGHGQSRVLDAHGIEAAWHEATTGARAETGRVIVEGEIDFDYEITLLTVRHLAANGEVLTSYCPPIGHRQVGGDYVESWQPQPMSESTLQRAKEIAFAVTSALADAAAAQADTADANYPVLGIFGVELFIKGESVYFSELSPRPHDTGMVTMASQRLNEFDLHARAILGLPLDVAMVAPAAASAAFKSPVASRQPAFAGVEKVLESPNVDLRIFGKPEAHIGRRMAVTLATGSDVATAREHATAACSQLTAQ